MSNPNRDGARIDMNESTPTPTTTQDDNTDIVAHLAALHGASAALYGNEYQQRDQAQCNGAGRIELPETQRSK
jgi:hypothetical protein